MRFNTLSKIYSDTLKNVFENTKSYEQFLKAYAYTYKHKFENALLIYRQTPNAKMVTDMNQWRDGTGRYIKPGAKIINVFEKYNKTVRYFDINDTYVEFEHENNYPKQWEVTENNKSIFESIDVDKLINDNLSELNLSDEILKKIFEDSSLDSFSNEVKINNVKEFIYNTNKFMIDYRSGKDVTLDECKLLNFIDKNESYIYLGAINSNVARGVLNEIETTINEVEKGKDYELQSRRNNSRKWDNIHNDRGRVLSTTNRNRGNGIDEVWESNSEVYGGEPRGENNGTVYDRSTPTNDNGTSGASRRDVQQSVSNISGAKSIAESERLYGDGTTQHNVTRRSTQDGIRTNSIQKTINNQELSKDSSFLVEKTEDTQSTLESVSEDATVNNNIENKKVVDDIAETSKINYKYNPNDNIGVGGLKTKVQQNLSAIKTLQTIENENRLATSEEQRILAQYNGFGGLAEVFDISKTTYHQEHKELQKLLSVEEYESARASTLNAYYTSKEIIQTIYKGLENFGFEGGRILEPSMGIGNFYSHLPASMSNSKLFGVELDSITGRIAKQLYQDANIEVKGYQKTNFSKNQFDVAIGNVPFGDIKPFDKLDNKQNFLIHDYFFAKTLDKVRPGGIIAFVTSKGTLDKKDFTARKYIAERADLLGAIRLPDTAFKQVANTQVTADIIFLQKRESISVENPNWLDVAPNDDGILINKYFLENPEMVLGEMQHDDRYGKDSNYTKCVNNDENFDLQKALDNSISNIKGNIATYLHKDDIVNVDESLLSKIKNYTYDFIDEKLFYRENDELLEVKSNGKTFERISKLVELRKATRNLINIQVNGCDENELHFHQRELEQKYDDFVQKFNYISDKLNARYFSKDNDYPILTALEKPIDINGEKHYKKTNIFTERTIQTQQEITSVETPSEALSVSMNIKGYVDIEYMSMLCNKAENEVIEDLRGQIFLNPKLYNEKDIYSGYETRDEYLSGDVWEKLSFAEYYAEKYPELFSINVEELKKVQPAPIQAGEIEVKISTAWIENSDYEKFIYELLDTPRYIQNFGSNDPQEICVNYNQYTSMYTVTNKSKHDDILVNNTFGTTRANAYRLFEDALNKKETEIKDALTDEKGNTKYVLNKEQTLLARNKQDEIKAKFKEWIFEDKERRDKYVDYYNQNYNNTVLREYDGSHLTFPNMSPEIKLREHQVNAVARTLYSDGNTLLAHSVGAGKTYEMIASAMEQKRIGLINKAMFVVPNHITQDFGAEFLRLYPTANVLVTTKKDFEKQSRQKFVSRIATGNYDAVVIGHTQFEKIPVSKTRQQLMLKKQIDNVINGIAVIKADDGSKWHVKQMESQKVKLEEELSKLTDSPKDDLLTFEELGVDALYVDEAHEYKNCSIFTKMRGIAGINTNSAKKSIDMLMKSEYINELNNGRGVVFATGTPISNTMAELFVMQRYLQSKELERLGLLHFDNWASQFGEVVSSMELSPEGTGFHIKSRFAKFVNLDELLTLFKKVADIKTKDMLQLNIPEHTQHIVESESSEFINAKMQSFVPRAESVRKGTVDPRIDNMLKITNEARNLSLDPRLIDSSLDDYANSKVQNVVEKAYTEYMQSNDIKGTQIIFSDLGTPKGNGSFSVYDCIKEELIKRGVPGEEICFIHDAKDDRQRDVMFSSLRSGEKRIIIGSTKKMGTGTNIQDKLVALHHLDVPWRPADMEQREGRILRQGNQNEHVNIYKYITKDTFDSYNWQILEKKQTFISQIMNDNNTAIRECDDISEEALTYAEVKAVAMGNPIFREKMEVENEIAKLLPLRKAHINNKYYYEDLIGKLPEDIIKANKQLDAITNDVELAKETINQKFEIKIDGTVLVDKDGAGALILNKVDELKYNEMSDIGTYKGFNIKLFKDKLNKNYLILTNKASYKVELGNSPIGTISRIDNKLKGLYELLDRKKEQIHSLEKKLVIAKDGVHKPFEFEEKLSSLQKRQIEIENEIKVEEGERQILDENVFETNTVEVVAKLDIIEDIEL